METGQSERAGNGRATRRAAPSPTAASSRDTMGAYLEAISRARLLTREEECRLARAASKGGARSKEKFIASNLRLVVSIARRYQGMGIALPDLIGEGNLGLIKATEYFDPELGFRFSTYASKWIRQAITRSLANHSRTVRIPANVVQDLRRYLRVERDLAQEGEGRHTREDVAHALGLPLPKVDRLARLSRSTLSMDGPLGADGELCLHDLVPDGSLQSPEDSAGSELARRRLDILLSSLDERERRILNFRFGLDGQEPLSLEKTGMHIGVTRERVRQIQNRCLVKLREIARRYEDGASVPPLA